MSAINQMLRDLDARTQSTVLITPDAIPLLAEPPGLPWRRLGSGLAVLLTAGVAGWAANHWLLVPGAAPAVVDSSRTVAPAEPVRPQPVVARVEPVLKPVPVLDTNLHPVVIRLAPALKPKAALQPTPVLAVAPPARVFDRVTLPVEKIPVVDTQVWLARAQQHRQNGETSSAIEVLKEGFRLSHDLQLVLALGKLLAETGQSAEAIQALTQGQSVARASDHALMGSLLARTGQHEGAVVAFRRALAQDATRGGWWLGLGVSLEALGQPDGARDAFAQAREHGQFNADVMQFLNQRLSR
ncbi:MAG: tetratricopeptide repeat protein [Thiobacillus sp.]